MDNSKYAYIVGRLRALDTKMMNQSILERLLDASEADQAYRVLNDMPLVADYLDNSSVKDFNSVLIRSLQGMKDLMTQMAPYPEVLEFLWSKYDFHNFKLSLKASLSGHGYSDIEHALIDFGTHSIKDWERYLLEGADIDIVHQFSKQVSLVKEAYEKTGDLQNVDYILDAAYLIRLKVISDNIGSGLIDSYLKRLIDFSNLKAYVRVTELGFDRSFFENVLLDGGYVSAEVFASSHGRTYDELRQTVEKLMNADDLAYALERFIEDKSMCFFERKIHEYQQNFMNQSSKIVFGPEPVFAFFYRFERHMQIIRAVLIGKINHLPVDEISKNIVVL
ncbi:V-type ATPase subunit [Candidatus Peregrinibacteria bacterium]|nr:V-type ATPase subunit [Candidatus Peregrinibacteria bacterium]